MSNCSNHGACGCEAAATAAAKLNIDQSLCPMCNGQNLCATEIAKATGEPEQPCWCREVKFTDALLAQVPAEVQGLACVCRNCAESNA